MINGFKSFIILFLLCLTFSGCAIMPAPVNVESGSAAIVTDITEGIDIKNAKANTRFLKKGKSCTFNFLYLVNTGNASIEKAKKEGNINKVHYVERTKSGSGIWFILPFIYSNVCTVVYGE